MGGFTPGKNKNANERHDSKCTNNANPDTPSKYDQRTTLAQRLSQFNNEKNYNGRELVQQYQNSMHIHHHKQNIKLMTNQTQQNIETTEQIHLNKMITHNIFQNQEKRCNDIASNKWEPRNANNHASKHVPCQL